MSDYLNPEFSKKRKKDHSTATNGDTPSLKPSLISSLPEPYIIPPVIPPEGFNRKITNSHKNAVLSLNFLPRKVEFERKNRFSLIQKEDCKFFTSASTSNSSRFCKASVCYKLN